MSDDAIGNWDDLRIFLAVARHPTVRAAARSLGVDPTTVTRRVASFEDQVGQRLFDRVRGGVILSPDGESLRREADQVEAAVKALERRIGQRDTELRGSVRITVADLLAMSWTAELRALVVRYPALQIHVIAGDEMHDLTRRQADVAIRVTDTPPPHLVGRRVARLAIDVYGAASIADGELTSTPWIGWTGLADDQGQIGRVRTQLGATGPVALRVNSYGLYVAHARAGTGLAIMPRALGEPDPLLQRFSKESPVLSIPVWVLTHPDLKKAPRIRAVMAGLTEIIELGPEDYYPPLN